MRSVRLTRALLALALGAAVAFALQLPAVIADDSALYLSPARAWAEGRGLIESPGRPLEYRLPAYPLFLGIGFRLFGESLRLVTLMNLACHIAAVFLAWDLIRGLSRRAADAAAAAALVYPPLLTATAVVLQESFLSLTLSLFAWATHRAATRPGRTVAFLAGASLGLSVLGKVTALPLALPAALLLAVRPSRSFLRPLLFLAGIALLLLPWAVRNQRLFGRFEVTNNNGGHTFLGGTVSNEISDWYGFPEYRAAVRDWEAEGKRGEPVLDRYLYGVGLSRIGADPIGWLELVAGRMVRFMLPARHWLAAVGLSRTGTVSPLYLWAAAFQGLLFVAAAWWAGVALRNRSLPDLVMPAVIFCHLVVYAAAYVSPRYNVTVGPLLFASLAGVAALRQRAAVPAGLGAVASLTAHAEGGGGTMPPPKEDR